MTATRIMLTITDDHTSAVEDDDAVKDDDDDQTELAGQTASDPRNRARTDSYETTGLPSRWLTLLWKRTSHRERSSRHLTKLSTGSTSKPSQ